MMCRTLWPVSSMVRERSIKRAGSSTQGTGESSEFQLVGRPIRPREFLSAEFCHINYCGYKVCYDRTFLVGAKPTELQREVYQTVVEMNDRVKAFLKPGITTRDIANLRPKPGENLKTSAQIKEVAGHVV